ncbi:MULTISPECIES: RDD family protein [Kitasatospora]|uniref:RDD family protein n=1 Tax=Kitasatospora TaxID=2063 RepID=UPI000C70B28D|nr:RDD family protein [Kitasatospora sp. GP30]MDH6141924.1 putative RDD family membrane protein YckC [Kitasatospora sp. GP30]
MSYAHWTERVLSFLIDMLACFAPNIIAGAADPGNETLQAGLLGLSLPLLAYNRWYQAGRTGQSWGRQLLGSELVGAQDGRPTGMLRAFLRDLAHLLDAIPCFLGFLWPLWDDRRQTFADKLADTVVLGD